MARGWMRGRPAGQLLRGRAGSRRRWNGLGFAVCAASMAYALYVQHVQGFQPCHLCIFQRVVMIALGLTFLAALLHDPRRGGNRGYAVLLGLLGTVGVAIAARHVWLQAQPPGSVAACGASLDVMFDMLPPSEVITRVFRGGAECQKIDWRFLGLSMPVWLMAVFAGLGAGGAIVNWRNRRRVHY